MLLEPVVGYTRLVSAAKVGFTLAALVLIGVLVALPLMSPVHSDFKLTFTALETTADAQEKPVMVNPRFQGTDSNKQPFNITAKTATKQSEQQLILKFPSGDITLADGGWITLTASEGALMLEEKTLDLIDAVSLYSSDGYEFHTESAHVSFDDNSAFGSEPVQVTGPAGTLEANGFVVEQRGERILFTGGVKMVLYPGVQEE